MIRNIPFCVDHFSNVDVGARPCLARETLRGHRPRNIACTSLRAHHCVHIIARIIIACIIIACIIIACIIIACIIIACTSLPGRPHITPGRPHITPGRPHIASGRPHITPGRPHIPKGRPHITPGRPHITPGRPHITPGRPHRVAPTGLTFNCGGCRLRLQLLLDHLQDFARLIILAANDERNQLALIETPCGSFRERVANRLLHATTNRLYL